jgi:hypothetical protein
MYLGTLSNLHESLTPARRPISILPDQLRQLELALAPRWQQPQGALHPQGQAGTGNRLQQAPGHRAQDQQFLADMI